MVRVLITGATGTVALAAGKHLCSQNHEVVGVSRSIEESESYTDVEQIDLLEEKDLERLEKLMEDVGAVFHLAWNLTAENFDTESKWEGNIEMFRNALNSAKNAGVPIFINGSSIHAGTGNIPAYTVEASLEDTPDPYKKSINPGSDFDLRKDRPEKLLDPRVNDPDSPYGESKIETEKMTREAVRRGDFTLGVSIRIGGVNEGDKGDLRGEPFYSSLYWSHRDLGTTVENIVTSDLDEKKGYHQFYGVSDNDGRIFNIENSFTTPKN